MRAAAFMLVVLVLAAAPASAGDGPYVEVPLDVDVYAEPGGVGEPMAMIKGGTKVNLAKKDNHWCKVYGPKVPNGEGWIWCGKGNDGGKYFLKEVTAEKDAPGQGGGGAAQGEAQPDGMTMLKCSSYTRIPGQDWKTVTLDISAKDKADAAKKYRAVIQAQGYSLALQDQVSCVAPE